MSTHQRFVDPGRTGGPVSVTASDLEQTSRDATVAQWSVAVVVMAGSAVAAWFTFTHLGEFGGVGVITALGVDAALIAWLRISRRLRGVGITSAPGHVLEIVAGLMTLYLNVGAAAFRGIDEHTGQYLLAFAHTFMPIIMVVLGFAGVDAQLKLRALRVRAAAEEHAARGAEAQRQAAMWEREQAREKAIRKEAEDRAERERHDTLRAKELDDTRHQREITDRREERAQKDRHLAVGLASVMLLSCSLQAPRSRRRQAIPNGSPGVRQPGSPAVHQPRSPGVHQPASPARCQPSSQVVRGLAELVELARPVLASDPGMGRPRLAKQLAAASGGPVSDYRARQVLAVLEAERDAAFTAELQAVISGNQEGG